VARKANKRRPQGSGSIRQLPSGRHQARYYDDDGVLRAAPFTFDTRLDAATWLATAAKVDFEEERADPTLTDYAATWLAARDLKPRTREEYQRLLKAAILPGLGALRLSQISQARVRAWYGSLDPKKATRRAHAYSLLKAVLRTAVDEEHLAANPCRIRGAGQAKTVHEIRPATLDELAIITEAMPPRYRTMVLLAAWCGLRYGELTALRRADLAGGQVRVDRGVVRVGGDYLVATPRARQAGGG
jgi:integrase